MELPRDSCIVLSVNFELHAVSVMSGLSYKTATPVHVRLSLSMRLVFASKPNRFYACALFVMYFCYCILFFQHQDAHVSASKPHIFDACALPKKEFC